MSDAERLKALEKQAANLEAAVFDKTQETELLRRRVEIGSGPGGCNYAGTLVDQLEKQLRDLQKENAVPIPAPVCAPPPPPPFHVCPGCKDERRDPKEGELTSHQTGLSSPTHIPVLQSLH